jgi:hypothetical protein
MLDWHLSASSRTDGRFFHLPRFQHNKANRLQIKLHPVSFVFIFFTIMVNWFTTANSLFHGLLKSISPTHPVSTTRHLSSFCYCGLQAIGESFHYWQHFWRSNSLNFLMASSCAVNGKIYTVHSIAVLLLTAHCANFPVWRIIHRCNIRPINVFVAFQSSQHLPKRSSIWFSEILVMPKYINDIPDVSILKQVLFLLIPPAPVFQS